MKQKTLTCTTTRITERQNPCFYTTLTAHGRTCHGYGRTQMIAIADAIKDYQKCVSLRESMIRLIPLSDIKI